MWSARIYRQDHRAQLQNLSLWGEIWGLLKFRNHGNKEIFVEL